MLKITVLNQTDTTVLELEGKLCGPWVEELRRCWLATLPPGRLTGPVPRVHLKAVSYVDGAGKQLLAEMHQAGAELLAEECMTSAIVAEISRGQSNAPRLVKPGRLKTLALFLAATLLFAPALRGQEKPPLPLTLRDAVRLALQQNPQVQIAALIQAQSQQDKNIALAALLPQAQLGVTEQARRLNVEANIGKRIPGFAQHVGPFQFFQAGPQFSMPLFDLTLWRRWQASREGVRASQAQQQSVREQVLLLVVSQYLSCLRAGADVRAAQSRVALAQALYEQAADLQRTGVGTGIDTLRANVELQNEKQRLIVAETQRRVALFGLSKLLNLDPRQAIELTDELSFFQTPEFHAEESLERAYTARPEMRQLEARERAVLQQKRAASEARLPAFSFAGNWAYQGLSAPTAIPTYVFQVDVGVPLWTSGRIRAEVARADLELKKIAQERDDLRNQIALEVKTAIEQFEAARHEVDVANLGVKLAQEEVGQARDRFQAGVANNIEVVSAQDALARANDNQIAALYRYNQARADLARAIGQMGILYTK